MSRQIPSRSSSPLDLVRHCLAYGVPFQLHASNERMLATLLYILPHGTEFVDSGPADAPIFSLLANNDPALLERLEHEIFLHVGVHAPHRIFLHAGVVAWQGRAILLPGATCTGKTTLVAELLRRGAIYYSDDYALLDASGLVHPYARNLRVREAGTLQQSKVPVHQLAAQAGDDPIPIAQVVFTEFAPGARWNPQPLTPGLAILELLRHTLPARHRPAQALATLKAAMRTAVAFRSPRGEAATTAQLLLDIIDRRAAPQ